MMSAAPLARVLLRLCRRILPALLALGALAAQADEGIRFAGSFEQLSRVEADMRTYLRELRIDPALLMVRVRPSQGALTYSLATPSDDTATLDLSQRPSLHIGTALVRLPTQTGRFRQVRTVSQKEILLALLQHGRRTDFTGPACSVAALREHVALRQNIVAWAEHLEWRWPNGEAAAWNPRYWENGEPRQGVGLHTALHDVFNTQHRYQIGCYTGTKLIVMQGILDYYRRIRANPAQAARVFARLHADGDLLAGIDPPGMWSFEADFDPADAAKPGKLLQLASGIPSRNFVPGDWAYLLNTDPASAALIGYEGSNALYLGRGRFADLYNDNRHAYTFREKLDEVYQWRHGVFSRTRDARRIRPLHPGDYARLEQTPAEGGLLLDVRALPQLFGYAPALD